MREEGSRPDGPLPGAHHASTRTFCDNRRGRSESRYHFPNDYSLCGTPDGAPPCTSGTGVLATGTNGTTVGDPPITFDELVEAIRSDSAYANVHTTQNQGGEIRGQIVPE